MIAVFWVYIWGYQLEVRFCSVLGCLQIIFLQNLLAFPQKSHECALQLTELWDASLLFDLNYKCINWSFAFSPG